MLELLAAIQSADPPSLVLWSLFVFAAGMYPIGFMLGSSCSPCCGQPCSACTTGSLPDTVTVTFDGFTDQTPGPDLIALSFSACFGGGASARVTAPGGDPDTDKGPISAVSLTNAGSGYAKLGRVAPTLTVSGGSGTGATFTPTLTSSNDACGVPSWTISSVAVKDGTGYVDGEALTVTIAAGDTEATAASVIINTTITQPTLTASVATGSGAVLSVTLGENSGSPPTWYVASVSVLDGGSGYTDGDYVEFSSDGVPSAEATAYILTGRQAPTLSGGAAIPGSGAVLTPTITQFTDYYTGLPYWSVTGFTIADGGAGYSELDPVFITVDDGIDDSWYPFSAFVASVDENGAITDIWIDEGGSFYKSDGVIQSVVLTYGGMYDGSDNGVPASVTVQNGGGYYREDASEPPYVADVTVSISQTFPSTGTGATLTATVEDDAGSEDFGKITGVSIENGGDSYLAHELLDTCLSRFDGRSIVCQRSATSQCVYLFQCDSNNCAAERESVAVEYRGPETPLRVSLSYGRHNGLFAEGKPVFVTIADGLMDADENVTDCSSFNVTCTGGSGVPSGATATVTDGGTYQATESCRVISDEELAQIQVTIEWDGKTWVATRDPYPPEVPCELPPGAADFNPIAVSFFNGCGMAAFGGFQATAQCEPWKFHVIQCNEGRIGVKGCDLQWTLDSMGCQYAEQLSSPPHWLVKYCDYVHRIVDIPVDDEGYPSGYATIEREEEYDQIIGSCEYPGLPSVSFSRLP